MDTPHVYDKSKYHTETVEEYGLDVEYASNHTVVFLRWLIENDLMSESFQKESRETIEQYHAGQVTIHQLYAWWDCCLIDDMLSDAGNKFAMHYFDFERGKYLHDYRETLQGSLPSEFHIEYSEPHYRKMEAVVDSRYKEWKAR